MGTKFKDLVLALLSVYDNMRLVHTTYRAACIPSLPGDKSVDDSETDNTPIIVLEFKTVVRADNPDGWENVWARECFAEANPGGYEESAYRTIALHVLGEVIKDLG